MTALDLPTAPLNPDLLDEYAIADALDRAAHLIQTDGLATGEYWDCSLYGTCWTAGRGCCTVGAIAVAVGHRDLDAVDAQVAGVDSYDPDLGVVVHPVHPVLAALMAHRDTGDPVDVMNWSDRATEREVLAELRACAATLRIHADDTDLDRIAGGEHVSTDEATRLLSLGRQAGVVEP